MDHMMLAGELVKTIQEERQLQAQLRREQSRRLARSSRSEQESLRMALGPGIQFGGVTEQLLDAVFDRTGSAPAT